MPAIYIIYSFGSQVLENDLILNDRKMLKTLKFSSNSHLKKFQRNKTHTERENEYNEFDSDEV